MNRISENIISTSSSQTEEIGRRFSERLKPGDVVFLKGELGSGKTTFVKGVAMGFGVESRIISPTFVIVREHTIENNDVKKMYHLDLYRLSKEEDLVNIDFKDLLADETGVVLIEWPDASQKLVKKSHWTITFEVFENDERRIDTKYE